MAGRLARPTILPLVTGLGLGLAGCLDLAFVRAVAFPPGIAGLPGDGAWLRLPVGAWLTDGDVEPVAVIGCLPPECSPAAAVAVFRARGPAGPRLVAEARDPRRLLAGLRARQDRSAVRSRIARSEIDAQPLSVGRLAGTSVRLARADGSRAAHGVALAGERHGAVLVVLAVAETRDAALSLATGATGALD